MLLPNQPKRVLTVNGGSSSLKYALYTAGESPLRCEFGKVERIGLDRPTFERSGPDGAPVASVSIAAPTLAEAIECVMNALSRELDVGRLAAVVHRVVHGGPRHFEPALATDGLIADLESIASFAPEHLPGQLELIAGLRARLPHVPHILCFDTAFHRTMCREARLMAIPRRYERQGVRRYGFHGLSYEYLIEALRDVAGAELAAGKVILAHLGSGASLAAVHRGQSVDTTMGFTPTSGLVMSTRCGDLDPGLIWYFTRTEKMSVEAFQRMINDESGLLGISETSPDMRDLQARRAADPRADEAIRAFVYSARKQIGAMTAVLEGVDAIVFSGGIGEHNPAIRAGICSGLEYLGVRLDPERNNAGAALISSETSAVRVFVLPTDEEIVMARAAVRMLALHG